MIEAENYTSVTDLLAATCPEEDVTLPTGAVIRVRGLTRYELLKNAKGTEDTALIERKNIATCMIKPPMSLDQAEAWQKVAQVDVIGVVSEAIRRLSGITKDAQKSNISGNGDD